MSGSSTPVPSAVVVDASGLAALVDALLRRGHRVVGPVVRDGAIVLGDLRSATDLPAGWGVDVAPGHYRLRRRADAAVFAHSAGPQSWKQYLHPPRQRLWSSRDGEAGQTGDPENAGDGEPDRYAFFGVRACDLAAIATLGRVLGGAARPEPAFVTRRRRIFVVAVDCTEPGDVCFCASMGTGPGVGGDHHCNCDGGGGGNCNGGGGEHDYDLLLTELVSPTGCRYVVRAGSDEGADVLAELDGRPATREDVDDARAAVADAGRAMVTSMPDLDLRELLAGARESPHWDDVADRCLACGNCTMVCPTCFCTDVTDVTDVTDDHAERWMQWTSCFDLDFGYVHGGSRRRSGAARYRHWISHKLGTWHDQFGSSGCVGCGRCIAWCPTGIDITQEVAALARAQDRPHD